MTLTVDKDGNLVKEPWNSSTGKAKELKIENWGTPEEVYELARPIRIASTRQEAKNALETIISANGTVKRTARELKSKSGLSACLRRSSLGKLVSGIQKKEMPKEALWLAVANIDRLYTNAIEIWKFEFDPNKNNDGLKDKHILYAPMGYKNCLVPVKFTVKEYLDPLASKKIYSIEVIDFKLK
jgi:hypothetical protein